MFTKKISLKERFLNKIKKTTTCWIWIGHTVNGYGYIFSGIKNKGNISAHRVSWTVFKGDIPKGLCVLHKCDNPSCVNPKHLFLGTHQDNINDMMKKGRHHVNPPKGEKSNLSKLTNKQVQKIRKIYKNKSLNIKNLSELLNLDRKTISRIVRKETYKNV